MGGPRSPEGEYRKAFGTLYSSLETGRFTGLGARDDRSRGSARLRGGQSE